MPTPTPLKAMAPERMELLMREWLSHLLAKCARKNEAYAETDVTGDALNNFREAEADWGIPMLTYAGVLQGKHYRAWRAYVRTGKAPDKPFRILGDLLVYCLLQYAILIDRGVVDHAEVLNDGD